LVVNMSQSNPSGQSGCRRHVGYYLLDEGFVELSRAAGAKSALRSLIPTLLRKFPTLWYAGGILAVTGWMTLYAWTKAGMLLHPDCTPVLAILFLLICSSQVAVLLANWVATIVFRPLAMPRLDFSNGVPAEHKTLVVIPTMLSSAGGIEDLIEALEIR